LRPGVRFSAGAKDFSLLHSVKIDSGAHPLSYAMGTRDFFPRGVNRPERDADDPLLSNAEVKNDGAILPLRTCLHGIVLN
jgi:hypothetical protein